MRRQRPLSLEDFVLGENAAAIACIHELIQQPGPGLVYLWGHSGSGKTHVAIGTIRQYQQTGISAAYLDLESLLSREKKGTGHLDDPHRWFSGLENLGLLALDNLHYAASSPALQEALFHLFNELRAHQGRLLVCANQPPAELCLELGDLSSRLAWGSTFHLKELVDADKLKVLQRAAKRQGMALPDQLPDYLMRHFSRDLRQLLHFLERIDYLSLSQGRQPGMALARQLVRNWKGEDNAADSPHGN
jgi:DnaA family protein